MSPADELAQTFEQLNDMVDPEQAREIGATYLFDIGGAAGGQWFADFTRAHGPWVARGNGQAQCTVKVSQPEDWLALLSGQLDPDDAMMTGKVQVTGNMALAEKLTRLLG